MAELGLVEEHAVVAKVADHFGSRFAPQDGGGLLLSFALDPRRKALRCAGKSLGDGLHLQELADASFDSPVQLESQQGDRPFGSSGTERHDASLVEIETKPSLGHALDQCKLKRVRGFLIRENKDCIVCIADELSFVGPVLLEPLVQKDMETDVGEDGTGRRALRRASELVRHGAICVQHRAAEHPCDEPQEVRITNALLQRAQEPVVVHGIEEFLDVHLDHDAAILTTANGFIRTAQRLMR